MGNEMQGGLEEAGASLEKALKELEDLEKKMSEVSKRVVGKEPIQLKQAFQKMSPESAKAIKSALSSGTRDAYVKLVSEHLEDALLGAMKGVKCFGGNQAVAREYFKNKLDPMTSSATLEDFGLRQLQDASSSLNQLMGTQKIEVKSVKCTGLPVKCELKIKNNDSENPVTVNLTKGMVLEQKEDERQEATVALCKDTVVVIPPGATGTYTVEGYCFNRGERVPSGSPMNITGLEFHSIAEIDAVVKAGCNQSAVWKKVDEYRAKLKSLSDSHISAASAASAAAIEFHSIEEIDAAVKAGDKQSAVWKKVAEYRAKLKSLSDSHISAASAASAAGII